jgi:hypothetical protein
MGPAIAFALSWNPLVKSKINATTTTAITMNSSDTSLLVGRGTTRCLHDLVDATAGAGGRQVNDR